MLDLGDHEQEEAWGERVTVDGQECRGVFAPLEGWYEVELGGRVYKVQTSLRVRRKALKGVPAAGRKVVAVRSGRAFYRNLSGLNFEWLLCVRGSNQGTLYDDGSAYI